MNLPVYRVHLKSARILCSNPAGLELLGLSGRDDLAGTPLAALFPEIGAKSGASGTAWLRIPNGPRRHLRWSLTEIPDRAGEATLVLDSDGGVLDGRIGSRLVQALEQLEQGSTPAEALREVAGALRDSLQLRLVRLMQLQGCELHERACVGEEQAAAAARRRTAGAAPAPGDPGLQAARERRQILMALDAVEQGSWQAELHCCGVRSALAWPIGVGSEVFVLELYGDGLDDLSEPTASRLLQQWLHWFEQRLPSAALTAGQKLAAQALASSASAAFITDTEGTIVWVNHAFIETYGHSEGEALGATPRLIKSGVHGPRYYRALWSALRSGQPWAGETVDRAADGREVVVYQTISPVRHGGRITHYLSIHADITDLARLRRMGERDRGIDEFSGVMTSAAFEERAHQRLLAAAETRGVVAWILCAVVSKFGGAPKLEPEALAYVRGVLGQRLCEATDPSALLGVLGPFDFAVLLHKSPEQAEAVAHDIAEAMNEPLPLLGASLELCCRTAIVRSPQHGTSVQELRLAADRLLAESEPGLAVFPAEATLRW